MKKSDFERQVTECDQLLKENNVADAVRLSGELLSQADSDWRGRYNAGERGTDEICQVLDAGAMHCLTLFLSGQIRDCYSTALMLDLECEIDGVDRQTVRLSTLRLRHLALTSLLTVLDSMPVSDDEQVLDHISNIVRYLSDLLYHDYESVVNGDTSGLTAADRAIVSEVHGLLSSLLERGMRFEADAIVVGGEFHSPERPAAVIGDLIGRSRALGLMAVD